MLRLCQGFRVWLIPGFSLVPKAVYMVADLVKVRASLQAGGQTVVSWVCRQSTQGLNHFFFTAIHAGQAQEGNNQK